MKTELNLNNNSIARVIGEYKGAYRVKDLDKEYFAKITGKQMFAASSREDYPAVGDWVEINKLNEEQAVIYRILPRKTIIRRKYINKNENQVIAANIDVAFIVEAVDRDYNLNRFERYIAIVNDGGIKPVIILNKIDLITDEELNLKILEIKNRFPDIDSIFTSTTKHERLDELKKYLIKGKTYCFLGSSGVGKSSLINKLLEEDVIKTESISVYSGRGKHVTTNREMFFLKNGAMVIDNPGMRKVGITDISTGIDNFFDKITVLANECKYTDCTHTHEPGCRVLSAVESNELDKKQYDNYINLKKEAEYYEMDKLEKRQKDRQFGKFVKRVKDDLKKYE